MPRRTPPPVCSRHRGRAHGWPPLPWQVLVAFFLGGAFEGLIAEPRRRRHRPSGRYSAEVSGPGPVRGARLVGSSIDGR